MIRKLAIGFALLTSGAGPSLAQDASEGAAIFEAQCAACHVVRDAAGQTLAGRTGRLGPNLVGIAGQPAGQDSEYRYGAGLKAAAEDGLVWDEANFIAYLQDPNDFLRSYTGDRGARSKMAWQVRLKSEAADLYAFLESLD
ncbi:c-type cytochrome [Tropicimonas aquimaris]|uniref:C-type cytochrome n=1 Tax=Tropicimonas aquimaris TaxID=914152 RepID=A0ABW3IS20_9RHOB